MMTNNEAKIAGQILVRLGEAIIAGSIRPDNFNAEAAYNLNRIIRGYSFEAAGPAYDISISVEFKDCLRTKLIIDRVTLEAQGMVFKDGEAQRPAAHTHLYGEWK